MTTNPPLLRLDETTVMSAALVDGLLVPRLIVPILLWQDGHTVGYGVGGREATYTAPTDPLGEAGEVAFPGPRKPYSATRIVFGEMKQLGVRSMSHGGPHDHLHRCPCCGAAGPWAWEWVVGALWQTARLECRTCWDRAQGSWVQESVRRLQPLDPAEGSDVTLG